ncbi:MAG: NUDIX domain-containing protein [Myxococcales bacterium]
MKESAGTLLYRFRGGALQVLLVRPSGFAARYGWSIPKGLPDPGEGLEAAARRETREEAGVEAGALTLLGDIRYTKSRKRIHCFTGEVPAHVEPRASSWEVAEARFVPADEARRLLHPEQRAFVDLLEALLRRA